MTSGKWKRIVLSLGDKATYIEEAEKWWIRNKISNGVTCRKGYHFGNKKEWWFHYKSCKGTLKWTRNLSVWKHLSTIKLIKLCTCGSYKNCHMVNQFLVPYCERNSCLSIKKWMEIIVFKKVMDGFEISNYAMVCEKFDYTDKNYLHLWWSLAILEYCLK